MTPSRATGVLLATLVVVALSSAAAASCVPPAQAASAQPPPSPVADGIPPLEHDPSDVRRTAQQVLRQPDYQPPERGLGERIVDELAPRLSRLLTRLLTAVETGPFAWGVVAVTLGAAGLLAWLFGRNLLPDRAPPVAVDAPVGRRSEDWHSDADAHEASGRWREAVRCRYRALLAGLDEQGIVDEVAGRTVGEYRRAVADRHPSLAAEFAAASDLFEGVWYGDAVADAEAVATLRALAGRAVGRPAAAR